MQHNNMTFEEMRKQLDERAKMYRDEYIPAKAIRMNPDNGNILHTKEEAGAIKVSEYELLPWGLSTLGTKLGIPGNYALKCPPELRAANFNYWLENYADKELFVRLDSAPEGTRYKIRAVLSKQYADFQNTALARRLESNIDSSYQFKANYSDDGCILIGELVSESPGFSNSEHAAGIHMVNSEVGKRKLVFQTLIYSKALKSGVIVKEWGGFSEKHIGDKTIIDEAFKKSMDNIMKNYGRAMQNLEDLKRVNIEDAEDMIAMISDSNKLTRGQVISVKRACMVENPKTLYDIVSVFTRASTEDDIMVKDRETLQCVGGTIMMNAKRYKRWEIRPEELGLERSVG